MTWVDEETLSAAMPPKKKEAAEVLLYVARKAKARFFADENFPTRAVEILRGMGAKVLTVQEAGTRRHPDENHAAFALREGLILLTCDRDFLDNRRFPLVHCPAIFVFDFGDGTEREMRQAYRCMSVVFPAPQFYDKWCKFDARRESWTETFRYQNGTTSRSRLRLFRGRIQDWVE
jgi:predicted nuclease of predicted toxin-antitoxin system